MGGPGFTGKKQIPDISDQVSLVLEKVVVLTETTTYIAVAPIGSPVDEERWSVRRVVEDTATGITRVTWATDPAFVVADVNPSGATEKFVHEATAISGLTYG